MIRLLALLLIVNCLQPLACFAKTITWDIAGLVDETGWSSWQGKKVAIGFFVNGIEIGRVWDNPANRTVEITVALPNYYKLGGRLYFFDAPYPTNPTDQQPVALEMKVDDFANKMRLMDDGSSADIKRNRVKGRGLVSFGPAR